MAVMGDIVLQQESKREQSHAYNESAARAARAKRCDMCFLIAISIAIAMPAVMATARAEVEGAQGENGRTRNEERERVERGIQAGWLSSQRAGAR